MKPLDFYFSKEHTEETVLFIIHRHWFNILWQYMPLIALLILMVMSIVIYPYVFNDILQNDNIILFFFILSLFAILIWIYAFIVWFNYYLDIWIITTERIVNVEQKGIFSRQVSELKYRHIQDVSTDVHGFFQTMLNYGDVHVQTAAEQSHFLFRAVPNPYIIKTHIMNQIKKHANTYKTY